MKIYKKLVIGLILLFGYFYVVSAVNVALAQNTIGTGGSYSTTVVTNCVNTNSVNSSGTPCSVSNNPVPSSTPNPSGGPTPTPVPGGNNNNNGGGGGGGGGGSSSCSDTKPVGTPLGLTAVAGPGPGQVTLTWGPPAGPFTTYSISYSDTSDTQKWGINDTGNVTQYTISDLPVGQYYFWVRAVNGCTQGDPSGPVTVGGVGGGNFGNVLGAAVTPSPKPEKQVLGNNTSSANKVSSTCGSCIWWPVILGELIALLVYYYLVFNKDLGKKYLRRKFVWGLAIPIIAYIIFILINKNCLGQGFWWFIVISGSFFCKWFWLIDAAVYAVVSYGWKKHFAPKESVKPSK